MNTAPYWRFLRRSGLALTAATAVLWLASGFFQVSYARAVAAPAGVNTGLGSNPTDATVFGLGHGLVGLVAQKFVLTGYPEGWSAGVARFSIRMSLSAGRHADRTYEYVCPIVLFIPIFAGVAGLGLWMERRRTPVEAPGACPACGYPRGDLADQPRCPECGTSRAANPVRHGPGVRPRVTHRRRGRPARQPWPG